MTLLPAPRQGGWLVLVLAAAAAGCDRNPANPLIPTGNGGTLAAEIGASATSGRAPIDISFTSNVHGGDEAYRYEWSFGDGRTSTAPNPRVQFLSGGSYDVRLQVSSGSDTVTAGPLNLRLESDVRLSCSADPEEAQGPVAVSFRADPSGGTGAF